MTATCNSDGKLELPNVTLCAVSSINVPATIRAIEASLAQVNFGACKLFTDCEAVPDNPGITVVPIRKLTSSSDYSEFLLTRLVDHVETSHCLVVQWDGYVLEAARWQPDFLDYDYIGASWPQFDDGHDVGNGGFSLRSRRLMQACRSNGFQHFHPEDVCIARGNRVWLESRGMRFADRGLADRFSAERGGDIDSSFGYHGVWHMPHVLGASQFWDVYRGLDDCGTIRHDLFSLVRQVMRGTGGFARATRLVADHLYVSLKQRLAKS